MSIEFTAPIQACTDPRHTGALREQLGCNGPDPAEQASAPASAPETPGRFVRGFRLIQRNGDALDCAQFPNGRVVVMDDPDWGLCSGARSLELLLRSGYHGARAEFADEQPTTSEAHVIAERDCLAMAVMFALQWKPDAPMSLRDGIEEILATMPARPEPTTKASEASGE
ncbi:hypothetical protein [Streptomyces cyaneofuscatus]|uniref:hypothetical protein n=1 Tax=Streptomyces cyaneofuscatus TaxID=66883 RepID=UPI00378F15C0